MTAIIRRKDGRRKDGRVANMPRFLGKYALLLVSTVAFFKFSTGGAAGAPLAMDASRRLDESVPSFDRDVRRRLAPSDGGGVEKFKEGTCYNNCKPYGGLASFTALMSGQCDCSWNKFGDGTNGTIVATKGEPNGERTCNLATGKRHSITCCGSLDNPGGVVLYLLIMLYSFLAIGIICDDYFCESLEIISERLNLSEDVAGATFMAAGSSAPELFTAIVSTLITESSEGLGTIVGSAVFNIMMITGASCLFAGQVLEIWWYPLVRDCIAYIISIVMMIIVMFDNKVHWWEALILLGWYGGYVYLMVINAKLRAWAEGIDKAGRWPILRAKGYVHPTPKTTGTQDAVAAQALRTALEGLAGGGAGGGAGRGSQITPNAGGGAALGDINIDMPGESPRVRSIPTAYGNPTLRAVNRVTSDPAHSAARAKARNDAIALGTLVQVNHAKNAFLGSINKKSKAALDVANKPDPTPAPEKEKEEEEEEDGLIMTILQKPIQILFKYSVPDCREKPDSYMMSFTMSITWIGILSFIMVDFGSRAGCVAGVPGVVMGVIVLAAGTSVPDMLASVLVAQNGQGGMAVANALGSNIFNIFVGLGLPWFVQALIKGVPVEISPDDKIVSAAMVLLVIVFLFLGIIVASGWELNKDVAWMYLLAHALFIVWALLTMLDNPVINVPF